jgi:6,7-dimethyl-8-ribityllumazine synthase
MSRKPSSVAPVRGALFKVAVVAARYNEVLVGALLDQVTDELARAGVKEKNLVQYRVPGSNELPIACQMVAKTFKPDVIVALGVIVRGDTIHYELIATAATDALQQVALERRVPVINGIVVAETEAQAEERCIGAINRGAEFAHAALAMAELKRSLSK